MVIIESSWMRIISLQSGKILDGNLKIIIWLTWALRYLRKKSNKKDFPFLKAPATLTTTTFLSATSGFKRISSKTVSLRINWCVSSASTTWIGCPWSRDPVADTEKTKQQTSFYWNWFDLIRIEL